MEQITVCLTQKDTDYEAVLKSLKDGLNETGTVSPDLTDFIASCLEQFGLNSIAIPEIASEFQTGKLRFRLRPRMAIVEMNPPAPNFREQILAAARETGLTALDNQNGYLFVPPTVGKRPWWKFWQPS
jgi:hypothetical protein